GLVTGTFYHVVETHAILETLEIESSSAASRARDRSTSSPGPTTAGPAVIFSEHCPGDPPAAELGVVDHICFGSEHFRQSGGTTPAAPGPSCNCTCTASSRIIRP